MRRLSARSWAWPMSPMFVIEAPVRPSMPSGLSWKSIVASDTIWLSSVIAKRWKNSSGGAPCCTAGQSSETPASVSQSRPRSAIRFVTRAKASRPLSVNSIVTSGSLVFGSKFCSGFLISLPESSESSSITKKRCTRADWFGAGSPSTTTIPCGTLKTREPSRRAGRAERLELLQALAVLRVLVRPNRPRARSRLSRSLQFADGLYSPSRSGCLSGPIG